MNAFTLELLKLEPFRERSVPLVTLARKAAAAQSLDPSLVCAIVEQESAWNPWAIRYEPAFFSKYVAPLYTNNKIAATEAYSRGFSWGLMQVNWFWAPGSLATTERVAR